MVSKKPGVDIVLAMGGPKKPSGGDEYDSMPDDNQDEGLPPEFELAWKRYHDAPTAQNFWDAVEACDQKVASDERMKDKWPGQADNFLEKQGSNSRQD